MPKTTLYQRSHGYALKQDERGECLVDAVLRVAKGGYSYKREAIEAYLAAAYVAGYRAGQDHRRRMEKKDLE